MLKTLCAETQILKRIITKKIKLDSQPHPSHLPNRLYSCKTQSLLCVAFSPSLSLPFSALLDMDAELSRLDAFGGDSYATDFNPPGLKGLGVTSSCPEALLPGPLMSTEVLKLSL